MTRYALKGPDGRYVTGLRRHFSLAPGFPDGELIVSWTRHDAHALTFGSAIEASLAADTYNIITATWEAVAR